jgi:hypothetical protein
MLIDALRRSTHLDAMDEILLPEARVYRIDAIHHALQAAPPPAGDDADCFPDVTPLEDVMWFEWDWGWMPGTPAINPGGYRLSVGALLTVAFDCRSGDLAALRAQSGAMSGLLGRAGAYFDHRPAPDGSRWGMSMRLYAGFTHRDGTHETAHFKLVYHVYVGADGRPLHIGFVPGWDLQEPVEVSLPAGAEELPHAALARVLSALCMAHRPGAALVEHRPSRQVGRAAARDGLEPPATYRTIEGISAAPPWSAAEDRP